MTQSSENPRGEAFIRRKSTVRASVRVPAVATSLFSPSTNGTSNMATPPSVRLVASLRPLWNSVTDERSVKTGTGCVQRPLPSSARRRG